MTRYIIKPATDTAPRRVMLKQEFFSTGVSSLTAQEVMDIIPCSGNTLVKWRKERKNIACEKRGATYHYPLMAVNKYLAKTFVSIE